MDLLLKCARVFKHLLGYQYHFVLGRKGVKREILLGFNETDFHHLVGIHKLRDLQIARGNRKKVFNDILSGLITYQTIQKSSYADECISRLSTFQYIEEFLDSNQLIFKYNSKIQPGSLIEGEFLMKLGVEMKVMVSFLFVDKEETNYFCRSFFPMDKVDYSKRQMQYTLLKKEKINLLSGEIELQYERNMI